MLLIEWLILIDTIYNTTIYDYIFISIKSFKRIENSKGVYKKRKKDTVPNWKDNQPLSSSSFFRVSTLLFNVG